MAAVEREVPGRASAGGGRARRLLTGVMAGVVLAVPVLAAAGPASAVVPGTNGLIACEGFRVAPGGTEESTEVFTIRPDGSGEQVLTDHPGRDGDPSWSPDAATIAFESFRSGGSEVWAMDADGTNVRQLTSNGPAEDRGTAWSPDGRHIAFHSTRFGAAPGDSPFEIMTMRADGTDQVRLTDNVFQDTLPSWSPDGSKIAFTSNRDGDFEIYVMNADGSGQTRLTTEPGEDAHPMWSPDGGQIAFHSRRNGHLDVFVMDADGSDVELVTTDTGGTNEFFPVWSPDGTMITYTGDTQQPMHHDVYRIAADGTGLERLTTASGVDGRCDWGRDAPPACDTGLSPVGCWAFDEPAGTTAVDASPFGNHGTYVNGPVLGAPGAIAGGSAVSLDGSNDHVVVPDAASLDVDDSFTLEGWILRDTDRTTHQLFNKGGQGFQLLVMDRFNGNQVWLRKAGRSTIVRTVGGVPADGRFHHVVATKDGPHSTQIYIDGVAQALQQVSPVQVIQDTAFPLHVSATASGNPIAGDIDAFAVYDRALTPGEVGAQFRRGDAAGSSASARVLSAGDAESPSGSGRAGAARSGSAASASCADLDGPESGVTAIRSAGLPCADAEQLIRGGARRRQAAGLDCRIAREDFSGRVVRITHECTGADGQRLSYITLS